MIEFVGQSRQDSDNIGAAPARLLNLYRERVGDRMVLKGYPGQVSFCDLNDILGRAIAEVGGSLFAVSGGALYEIRRTSALSLMTKKRLSRAMRAMSRWRQAGAIMCGMAPRFKL